MRAIRKRTLPNMLVQWRQTCKAAHNASIMPFDYEALRREATVISAVEQSLYTEQGRICAYTGLSIDDENQPSFHIEHMSPQKYCKEGEDTEYSNLVACWPKPNSAFSDYGAVYKSDWPSSEEECYFIKPTSANCEARFTFKADGKLEPANPADNAACITIAKLNLNHKDLKNKRKRAIDAVLLLTESCGRQALMRLLDKYRLQEKLLDAGGDIELNPFCFAIRQVLADKIKLK